MFPSLVPGSKKHTVVLGVEIPEHCFLSGQLALVAAEQSLKAWECDCLLKSEDRGQDFYWSGGGAPVALAPPSNWQKQVEKWRPSKPVKSHIVNLLCILCRKQHLCYLGAVLDVVDFFPPFKAQSSSALAVNWYSLSVVQDVCTRDPSLVLRYNILGKQEAIFRRFPHLVL